MYVCINFWVAGLEPSGVDAAGADPDASRRLVPDVPAAERPGVPAAALAQLQRGAQDHDGPAGAVLREARAGRPEVVPRGALPVRLRLAPPARGRDRERIHVRRRQPVL